MTDNLEKDYHSKFCPETFLQMFYAAPGGNPDEKGFDIFLLDKYHSFSSKYHHHWDSSSAKILEFGGGPVICHLISVVPYVKEVVFAAHTEKECQAVQKWRGAEEGSFDWSLFFKYVVQSLEGKTDDVAACKARENLLRNRLTSIVACDITKENPLESGIHNDEFDIIQTSFCLETACQSYEEFKSGIKKLAFMLKKGGFMVVFTVEGQSFYTFGQRKWYSLCLTDVQVREALEEGGLEVLEMEREPAPAEVLENPIVCDYKALVYSVAKKN